MYRIRAQVWRKFFWIRHTLFCRFSVLLGLFFKTIVAVDLGHLRVRGKFLANFLLKILTNERALQH